MKSFLRRTRSLSYAEIHEVVMSLPMLRPVALAPFLVALLLTGCASSPETDDDDDALGDDDSGESTPDSDCLSTRTIQGIDLVQICAGTFQMGCTPEQSDCAPDESPTHQVTLTRDFWLGRTEITQAEWQSMMGNTPSFHSTCGDDCPVEMVTWYEALAFTNSLSEAEGLDECYTLDDCVSETGQGMHCGSVTINSSSGLPYDCVGYRLPSEAEWEYAARADSTLIYAGSDTIDDVGWYLDNSGSTTHPVGLKAPNNFDLVDMSGNVWEWMGDGYDPTYYNEAPTTDPLGPLTGDYRSYRSGAWYAPADFTRVARRNHDHPENRGHGLGLRIAMTHP